MGTLCSLQVAHHGAGSAQFLELRKDQAQPRLPFFVWMEDEASIVLARKTDWQAQAPFAALGFWALTRVQPHFEWVQFGCEA